MCRYLFVIGFIFLSSSLFGQDSLIVGVHPIGPVWKSCDTDSLNRDEKQICTRREIFSWLSENIKIPPHTKNMGITNTKVIVQFAVSKTGEINDVKIIKSVHPIIDEQVKKAIEIMPDFVPEKSLGKNIDCPIAIPILIELK